MPTALLVQLLQGIAKLICQHYSCQDSAQVGNEYSGRYAKVVLYFNTIVTKGDTSDMNSAALRWRLTNVYPLEMAQAYATFPNGGASVLYSLH